MRTPVFLVIWLAVAAAVFGIALGLGNDYVFFAGYVVLQYVVLATAWNILGGYCGYVNFGSAAFFALGAYSTVAIYKFIADNDVLSDADSRSDADRRRRVRHRRLRHGLSDAAAARRVLRHRDAGARRRAADAGRQLGLCRRLARRLCHPPRGDRADRQLHQISVPDHAAACRRGDHDRAADRAFAARLRLCHHPRRRTRGRSLRRADAAIEAHRDHDFRRTDGHGRRAVSLLHRLSAAGIRRSGSIMPSTRSPCR